MRHHYLPTDGSQVFDPVCTGTTILAQGDPSFLNISVLNHGELSSRETCRLLRPHQNILKSTPIESINKTTSSTMTRSITTMKTSTVLRHQTSDSPLTKTTKAVVLPASLPGASSSRNQNFPPRNDENRMRLVVTARMGGKLASSQEQLSDITSSYHASDELNTPEIGLNSTFRFGSMPQLETSGCSSATTDMEVDSPTWGDMSPIPINNNLVVGSSIADDIFTWSTLDSLTQQQVPQRPMELKLKLNTTPVSNSLNTPNLDTPNLSTPNMTVDTPDVLHQLDNLAGFNILAYMDGKSEVPALDSPLLSQCFLKTSTKCATTFKREQTFIEDEEILPTITLEVPTIIPDNNSQDILITDHINNNDDSFNLFNLKVEPEEEEEATDKFVVPPTPTVTTPFLPVQIESPSTPEIIVPEIIPSRKRSCRLISNESKKDYNYDSNSESEEASCSYKRSRRSSVSSRSSVMRLPGKRAIKMEEEDEDGSSLTGSAAGYKYSQLRHRNNEASRRSRLNRKSRESEMEKKANELTQENRRLHSKVDRLDHLVTTLRKALLESITKANKK